MDKMSSNIFSHTREAVRVKVKKCEPNLPPEWRKFSVDPQITSLEVLYSLLAKAFDIKSDFSIKYKAYDPAGNEIYLAVFSDWDLDAAFHRIHNISIQTSTEPCLMLQIDIKPFTEVKGWDPDAPVSGSTALIGSSASSSTGATPTGSSARELMSPLQQSIGVSQKYVQQMQTKLPGLILNQMEKTFSMVQKAFNLTEETMATLPPRPPLADNEFRMFLDALGQIQRSDELRKVIFLGGIDPSLRRVVWKHILNVYPCGMNGHQRMDYMRRKSEHYHKLRDTWKAAVKQGFVVGELAYVTSMVKKDVLRTDRLHPFYAGSDDNQNIASLFNILTTYALNHPSVSYCQGMSDIASPLLVTMNDEAQAYICFCAIMSRVRGNFMLDGIAMTQKFTHLTEALSYYDSEFWDYLKAQQADDLLFCYRWLLLELKREFPFEDALRMLEVQWSSLKYERAVDKELKLYEKEFVPTMEATGVPTPNNVIGGGPPVSPSYLLAKPRENAYTKVCALRRQSSSASLNSLSSSMGTSINNASIFSNSKLDDTKRLNHSLDDNIARHATRRQRRATSKAHQSMDETKMLQLLEGRAKYGEAFVCPTKSENQQSEYDHTVDDDVFSEHSCQFAFHDTNPFKDDTASNADTDAVKVAPKHPIHIAFLSSSSSSIVGEDIRSTSTSSGGTGDAYSSECNSPPALNNQDSGEKKPLQVPKGIAKLQHKNILSNYNTVSNIIAKQLANASTVGESVKRVSSSGGGHFKDLKEKIAATSRIGLSLDECNEKSQQQRLVKNFNEFLNFAAANKNRVGSVDKGNAVAVNESDICVTQNKSKTPSPQKSSLSPTPHPLVQLTKGGFTSSFEESDSSSLPDTTNTTWSCSTAATAIQQTNNLSSNSLHLELNSLSSLTHTPERTPTVEPGLECEKDITPTSIPDSYQPMRQDDSSATPDDSQDIDYYPMTTAITRELHIDADKLDRQVYGDLSKKEDSSSTEIEYEKLGKDSLDMVEDLKENEIGTCPRDDGVKFVKSDSKTNLNGRVDSNLNINGQNVHDGPALNPFLDESTTSISSATSANITKTTSRSEVFTIALSSSSLPEVIIPISTAVPDATAVDEMATTAAEEEVTFSKGPHSRCVSSSTPTPKLPPPSEFGGGNPFLMFLCLTLLLQHRNIIIKSNMDYNEIAMHFDKMVRKHDVTRVLNQARRMYIDYLKTQAAYNQEKKLTQEPQQPIGTNAQNTNDFNRNATNVQRFQQHSNSNHSNHGSSSSIPSSFYTKS